MNRCGRRRCVDDNRQGHISSPGFGLLTCAAQRDSVHLHVLPCVHPLSDPL